MTRRLTLSIAIMAMAALALFPGVASAQAGSPPVVAGIVLEAPAPAVAGAPAPAVLGETLPRTGSNVIPLAIGAFALLLVGSVLVVSARRRSDDGSVRLA